jgi:8-oxo-(d)GTP phosphatase
VKRTPAGPPDLTDRPDVDVLAAGAVLWRAGRAGSPEVAVVHRPRYDDWSLPKGKAGRGELLPATAVREVAEETGCRARLGMFLADVHYTVPEGRKAVRFWAAEALDSPGLPGNAETDALCWLPPVEAAALLSHAHERDVLHRFAAVGPPTSVLVLVRHAKAGSRRQWNGDDVDRPLSGTGRDQAERLAMLLPPLRPDRLCSAPPARCRDSLRPLVDVLGGPGIGVDPLLGETAFAEDPDAVLARLRELAAQPGVTVACSQGGVIPAGVGALVRDAARPVGVDPDAVPARKASTWVLTLRRGVLVGADYFSRPTG